MGVYREYRRRLLSPDDAIARVKSGDTIVHGPSVSEPPALLTALGDRARQGDLSGLKVYSSLPMQHAARTVLSPDLSDCIESHSWFVTEADRSRHKIGLSYYVPTYIHEIPRLMQEHMQIDIMMTTVSPMDKYGYFTFGAVNDYNGAAARACKTLIVEVNENMPRVLGDTLLHISEVDLIVENHVPLLEIHPPAPGPEDETIGRSIAEMVPDGATVALGIGGIPNAIGGCLSDHQNLGIHSGVFTPVMVDLIESGVVNGRNKNLHPRKHVFIVAQGTRRMYDFIHDNPSMESHPSSYTEDPAVIARNDTMIAVNTVMELDLTGQCNAEHMAGSQFSGTGGQLDFVRGAYNSKGGKSIQAFTSTARKGTVSRILPRLKSGTVVSIPRMDVQFLVSEYGSINLKGKSTRDRALGIIALAHPDFRDKLLRAAEDMYLL
jgi:itaconate CoA-transferase